MDFAKLTTNVLAVVLGGQRMTDIATGSYSIVPEGDDKIYLVSEKKEKVLVSAASLAALRIVSDATKAAAVKTTREARESGDYSTLQKALVAEQVKLSENTRLNVVHRLQIMDTINDAPVYKNDCYQGYPEYMKASRSAFALPSVSPEQITARNNAFTEASENLRKTGLKKGITADNKHLQLMPVFTVAG
jgi:hypothetical protein